MGIEARHRVLVVTRNFPPLTGGMERLNHQAYLAMHRHFDVAVCGPTGAGRFLDATEPCREVAHSPLSRFLASCQWSAWRLARRHRPNIVYSGSGLTAPAALVAGRSVGARVACFLHGLDIVADHAVYRSLFLPAIRRCDRILVNSQYTADLALAAGVSEDRIAVVHPGVDLPDLSARAASRARFRERFVLGERPLLLAAGRITRRKGLVPFIQRSLPEIIRRVPDVVFAVVGGEALQALHHRRGVVQEIEAAVRAVGAESNVRMLGRVDDELLSEAYFSADLLVFPVLESPGDVEGFGMVAVEAAAHGLPTVAFRAGGVGDAVAEGRSGWLIAPGDYNSMTQTILGVLNAANEESSTTWPSPCRAHAERFAWSAFENRLLEELRPITPAC